MAAQAAASAPALLRPWVGNTRMFGNRMALRLEESFPFFKNVNNGICASRSNVILIGDTYINLRLLPP